MAVCCCQQNIKKYSGQKWPLFLCSLKINFMKASNLTLNIAWQITSDRFLLNDFYKHAEANQFIYFTHTPFFYSYPIFGKIWANSKACQFHQVNTCCHICGHVPERNYAGYGTLILQRSGQGNRMNLVCADHISGTQFNPLLFSQKQLALF